MPLGELTGLWYDTTRERRAQRDQHLQAQNTQFGRAFGAYQQAQAQYDAVQHARHEPAQINTFTVASVQIRQALNRPQTDVLSLLQEFSTAFDGGIREVIVSDETYLRLIQHFNLALYSPELIEFRTIIINTAHGGLKITPERANVKHMNWDMYMEDVE